MKKLTFSRKKNPLLSESNHSQIDSEQIQNPIQEESTINQNRRDDDTPPDLDELVSKIKESLVRKRKPSQDNGGGQEPINNLLSFNPKYIIYTLILIFIVWLASGFYIVNPAERGVVLRLGEYVKTSTPGPNWHLPYPIAEAYIVDVDQIRNVEIGYRSARNTASSASSIASESLMLTIDENIVDVRIAVQYRVNNAEEYLFNVRDPDITLTQAVESAIRETVGKSTLNFVLTNGRDQVAESTRALSQEILDRYETGITITSINMQDAQPPEQVQDAFNDAVRAREDQQRLINQAEAYSNDIIPKARGLAARMIEEAQAYSSQVQAIANGESERFISVYNAYKKSPDVTKTRLFIETMEQVMENTSKVVIEGENADVLNLIGFGGAANNAIKSILPQNYNANSDNSNSQDSSNSSNQNNSATNTSNTNNPLSRLERAMQRITRQVP